MRRLNCDENTHGSKLSSVHLDVLDVCLDLGAELLEMLYDGSFHSLCEVCMVVCNVAGLLALLSQKGMSMLFTWVAGFFPV
jgi:hypothetical protein